MAEVEKVDGSLKREELNEIAVEEGLADVETYQNKGVVEDAINRVRSGEDAEAVNEELKVEPEEDDSEDSVATGDDDRPDHYQARKTLGRDGETKGNKEVKKSRDSAENIGVKPRKKNKK